MRIAYKRLLLLQACCNSDGHIFHNFLWDDDANNDDDDVDDYDNDADDDDNDDDNHDADDDDNDDADDDNNDDADDDNDDNDNDDDNYIQEANERASLLAQDVDEQHAKQEQEARIKIQWVILLRRP